MKLLGLKEGIERDNMTTCIENLLSEGLGVDSDNESEAERVTLLDLVQMRISQD